MKISEEELIEYAKPVLKEQGFVKKAKRWTKVTKDFTYCFFIQGSYFSKEDFYVRPGIIINAIEVPAPSYGHIFIDNLKQRVADFIEWERRNPIENRRSGIITGNPDHPCLFTLSDKAKEAITKL